MRDEVFRAMNIEVEAEYLLGTNSYSSGDERKYRCPQKGNHKNGDASPALVLNVRSGLFRCMVCGFKGDIFELYGYVNNTNFADTIQRLATKYGLNRSAPARQQTKAEKEYAGVEQIPHDHKDFLAWLNQSRPIPQDVLYKLTNHYGITLSTATRWGFGYRHDRLWMPIPRLDIDPKRQHMVTLISIKKHDVMRKHCDSDGAYRKYPKTVAVKGFNPTYLYPLSILKEKKEVYLVGGELKAILLNQFGVPAVTFTNGEGSYNKGMLKYFLFKKVRVLMDIDEKGVRAAFGYEDDIGVKHAGLAQIIANAGADEVYAGMIPTDGMPDKGDITDYMRINNWDPTCLDRIVWTKFEREIEDLTGENEKPNQAFADVPTFAETKPSKFEAMFDPRNSGKWIRVPYSVAGRATTPYLLPHRIICYCDTFQKQGPVKEMCHSCPIAANNGKFSIDLKDVEQVTLVGESELTVRKYVRDRCKLPTCMLPTIDKIETSVDVFTVIPTLDDGSAGDQFNYRQHRVYLIGTADHQENSSYDTIGRVVPNPKDSTFAFVVSRVEPLGNDIFSWRYDEIKHNKLHYTLWEGNTSAKEVIEGLVSTLSKKVLYKYGADKMVLFEMLCFFMPFDISVGPFKNYKVCPEVCIIGDTRVGKSSLAKDLLRLYNAGRYVDADGTSAVGLVGGVAQTGGKSAMFTWGILPMSHKAICVLDEVQKFPLESIGSITNLRSSGIAERTTAYGIRKIAANVRIMWLCNPRGPGRSLSSYSDPVRAAVDVFGTPQDTARLDLLHAQYEVSDASVVNSVEEHDGVCNYTEEVARYHIKWAWNIGRDDIVLSPDCKFEYILHRAIELVTKNSNNLLFPKAETKFKILRVAAGLAALSYSTTEDNKLLITKELIDYAVEILSLPVGSNEQGREPVTCPDKLERTYDMLDSSKKMLLNIFLMKNTTTSRELQDLFNNKEFYQTFITIAVFDLKLVSMKRQFFTWGRELKEATADYLKRNGNETVETSEDFDE